MANTNNYAEQFSPDLLEILVQGTLTSPFITSNVKWVGARTFHFTQMSTSGFKNHNRNGGWNKGKYVQTDVPFTCEHDRDIEFLVDKADVDETNSTASVENISKTLEQTQVAPETDALFFSKVATKAQATDGYHSSTKTSEWTKENANSKLKTILSAGKLRRYKARGTLVAYVTSHIMDCLEQSTEFTRKIELTQIAEGGIGIETRETEIDGGFEPATGAHKINVLVACGETCKTVPKISSIYFFAPGSHTEGDGWLYQNRSLSDTFVFPNGKDGKIDSIYADVDTTAVA